ncbi:hypothetical protein BJV74DRAFT_990241 [Russula compacta]|nr:hypothetical protein BJV74DRAFT_990241 [Russula compacta]
MPKHIPSENLTSSSAYPQQEFAPAQKLRPTTPHASALGKFSVYQQIYRGTTATRLNLRDKAVLCKLYTYRGRCPFGASCKFIHDATILEQEARRRDRKDNKCMSAQPEDTRPSMIMKCTPCHSEHEPTCDAFYPVDRLEVSSSPLVSQLGLCAPPTMRLTQPLSLASDVGLGREECSIIINDFLVSKISLSLPCHPVRVRLPVKGTWDYPSTSSQPPQAPSLPHSCSIGTAASPHVQSPRECPMPSSRSHSSTALPVSRPHPLKDLVDELPPFPFPHSPLTDFLGKLDRSVTYEDLLTGAKGLQSRPLRLRRRKSWAYFKPV